MLKVIVFLFSFSIGCEVHSLLSDESNVIDRFPVGKTGVVLEVQKNHAHFFLAEYDFIFVLKRGVNVIDSVMVADTGGRSRIEVLKSIDGRTVLQHYGRAICIDKSSQSFDDYCDGQKGAMHIGSFDFDSSKRWRFIPELN